MIRLQLFSLLTSVTLVYSMAMAAGPGQPAAAPAPKPAEKTAAQIAEEKAKADAAAKASNGGPSYGARSIYDTELDRERYYGDLCKGYEDKVYTTMSDLQKSCSGANLGTKSECLSQAKDCFDKVSDKEYKDNNALMLGAGTPDELDLKCPKSADDASNLEKKIESYEKRFEDLQRKVTDDKQKTADKFSKLQKEIAETDKAYAEDKANSSEAEMKRRSDQSKALIQLTEDTESAHATMLEAQAKKAQMLSEKAEKLAQLSNAINQIECEDAVMELAAKLKLRISNSGSSQSMIRQGAKKNNTAQVRFRQCMKGKNDLRTKIIQTYDGQLSQIDYTIARVSAKIERNSKSIQDAQNDAKTASEAAAQKNQSIEAKYQQDKLRMINELQNLNTTSTEQETANKTNLYTAQTKLNRASNDLARIGGSDAGNVKKTFNDVLENRGAFEGALRQFTSNCCGSTSPTTSSSKPRVSAICTAHEKKLDTGKMIDQLTNTGGTE